MAKVGPGDLLDQGYTLEAFVCCFPDLVAPNPAERSPIRG
jgi:hypothetical protein